MPELMIFKAGKYPQGDWPKERVQKLVDAYDPVKNFEAPVVIGHKFYSRTDADQFAHGWVSALRIDNVGKVYAQVDEFSADVKKAVAEKKLRYISVEFYEYDKRDEGAPPYLKAIALLGRDTPAVQGAKLPAMFDIGSGVMNTLDEKEFITAFTRKVDGKDKDAFAEGACAETNQKIHEEAKSMDEEKLKAMEAELAASKAQAAAFQKECEELREGTRTADAAAFFGKLRDEGKLPPAQLDRVVSLDAKLGDAERKEFRAMFGEMELKVDLSGKHAAPKSKAAAAPASDAELTAKIRAFQKANNLSSFADAAEAYYAENPAAFEEEGGAA